MTSRALSHLHTLAFWWGSEVIGWPVSLVAAFCFIYTCHGLELVHRAALRSFKLLCWECGQQASERFPFIAWYLYRVWHVSRTEVGLWRSHHGQKGFRSKKLSVGLRIGRFLIPDRWGHTYLNNAISVTTFSFPPNIDKMCSRNTDKFWLRCAATLVVHCDKRSARHHRTTMAKIGFELCIFIYTRSICLIYLRT